MTAENDDVRRLAKMVAQLGVKMGTWTEHRYDHGPVWRSSECSTTVGRLAEWATVDRAVARDDDGEWIGVLWCWPAPERPWKQLSTFQVCPQPTAPPWAGSVDAIRALDDLLYGEDGEERRTRIYGAPLRRWADPAAWASPAAPAGHR